MKKIGKERKAAEWKRRIVDSLVKLINEYPVIAVINMQNMPALQLQQLKRKLSEIAIIKMARRRFLKLAIERCKNKKNIDNLKSYLEGMVALLFSKENPFKLFSILEKNKNPAFAKPGQIAPRDIVVPAGPTPFAPGPIISELAAIGIKTVVEGGKIVIKESTIVAKAGEPLSSSVTEILSRLGIKPMELGIDLVAAYEDGIIYTKDILAIDKDLFMQKLSKAHVDALTLAVESNYFTKESVELLILTAFAQAKKLVIGHGLICDLLIKEQLRDAAIHALALKEKIGG